MEFKREWKCGNCENWKWRWEVSGVSSRKLTIWIMKMNIFKFWEIIMGCVYDTCLWFYKKPVRVRILPLFLNCQMQTICILDEIKIAILAHSLFAASSFPKKQKKPPRYQGSQQEKWQVALFNLEREKKRKTVRKANERTLKNSFPLVEQVWCWAH